MVCHCFWHTVRNDCGFNGFLIDLISIVRNLKGKEVCVNVPVVESMKCLFPNEVQTKCGDVDRRPDEAQDRSALLRIQLPDSHAYT